MFRLISMLFIVLVSSAITYAQKYGGDYIVTDSSYIQGNVFQVGNGELHFKLSKNSAPVVYLLNDIKEYGFDGRIYEKLTINGAQQFLERIVTGTAKIYLNRAEYLLSINDRLTSLNKKNYRRELQKEYTDENNRFFSRVIYSKTSIRNFFELCNKGKSGAGQLAYRKFGTFVGYNFLQFSSAIVGNDFVDKTSSPSISIFGEFPLYHPRTLYISAELGLINANPFFYNERQNTTNFIDLTINGFTAPIGFKWTGRGNKTIPYIKFGTLISYLSITSPSGHVETTSTMSVVEISKQELQNSKYFLWGVNSAIGLEIPYSGRKNFHLELKHLKSFKANFESGTIDFSGLFLALGFNI